MAKGTFNESLSIVISLVLAVAALILIWYFHQKIFAFFGEVLLEGLKNFIFCTLRSIIPFGIGHC